MKDRRLIEETFPVKRVSEESAREKSIRHGHISTLHTWWARRPLASSRATSYAALLPAPGSKDELSTKRDFIVELCKWKHSFDPILIKKARADILEANGGSPPRVLDPFAGGGAIPLETLRLGCEVSSGDYNPVAVLIQKCTLEYPQKYGNSREDRDDWAGLRTSNKSPLLEDLEEWGRWVLDESWGDLSAFYPKDPDGFIPVGYIWARTIPCQNPLCQVEIPLVRQFWLVKTKKRRISLLPQVVQQQVILSVVGDVYGEIPKGFDPQKGTVSGAVVTCLACGSRMKGETTRSLFVEHSDSQRLLAVVTYDPATPGKKYRAATEEDLASFEKAAESLSQKQKHLAAAWGLSPVPDEPLPLERARGSSGFRIILYGMKSWGDLYNPRQALAMITFAEKIREAHDRMLEGGFERDYAAAIASYLAMTFDRLANHCCVLSRWDNTRESIKGAFSRQALGMVWDYAEVNPSSGATGSWDSALNWVRRVIDHASRVSTVPATVRQFSATSIPYPDGTFDAVLTDPPYYDNVAYGDLSDFFYVWLKRIIGHIHPDLFSTPLVPKTLEIIEDRERSKDQHYFEENLTRSFREILRVLRPGGVAIIVYAHKSTEGWETLINSLLDSGLVTTGAWPIHTEMRTRLVAHSAASLASSIYLVARKMTRESTGFYTDVKDELTTYLDSKLDRLWEAGIGGADFFISAIGSAIEIFGKYEKVIDYEGTPIRADRLLIDVRRVATDYAVRQILHNGFGGDISDLTRLYVLWRWEFGEARVHFDDARKLAQSCGIDLSQEWNRDGFVRKEKEFVRFLGPHERDIERLGNSQELIDVLHRSLLHWEKGERDEMTQAISDSGLGLSEAFYRVAQAISETLPIESKEKKLLDGFLAGRERVREEVRRKTVQTRLT